jgi:hypothetical protein
MANQSGADPGGMYGYGGGGAPSAGTPAAGGSGAGGIDFKNMTPAALRLHSKQQGWQEDFDRFSDGQLQQWLNKYWDPSVGRFKSQHTGTSGTFEKPTECQEGWVPFGSKENVECLPPNDPRLYPGQGGNSGSGVTPVAATPQTFGRSGDLSYTGNPMTDMLISQFNNKNQLGGTGSNIFGAVNGRTAGEWSDPTGQQTGNTPGVGQQKQSDVAGQMLKGGGLWWTDADKAKDVFGKAAPAQNAVAQTGDTSGLYNAQKQGNKSVAGMLANQYSTTTNADGTTTYGS